MTSNTFLRFIAILLIANSHLDDLYPVSALATGGSIGNALFFMLSGYGLFLSEQNRNRPFLQWYGRRIIRIYPSVVIVSVFLFVMAPAAWRTLDLFDYIKLFVWPTNYWFISALMIYYLIFFAILKRQNYRYFLAGIFILAVPYFYFYLTAVDLSGYSIEGPGYFKWIFYLQAMFFGGYLAGVDQPARSNFVKSGSALVLLLGLYYGVLIFMSRFGGWQFQAVTHLLMFPILFLFLKVSQSDAIVFLMRAKYAGAAISFMAMLTLEIYLVHGPVRYFSFVRSMFFPMNILVFWGMTVFWAYVLNRAIRAIKLTAAVETFTAKKQRIDNGR